MPDRSSTLGAVRIGAVAPPAKVVRVGVICDLREEGWHSMDLIADMLLETLAGVAGSEVRATGLCPRMVPRWTRLPLVGGRKGARLGDRLTGRLWDYPRWLAPRVDEFDVFHIVDHSYAHLVRVLPAERTIVTCHDLDAIQAALPGGRGWFTPASALASHILDGLSRAGHIACVSDATRDELAATGCVNSDRLSVVSLGVHPSCSVGPAPKWDEEIDRRLGSRGVEILHVGSTIPRKRIDVLLNIVAGVRKGVPGVRLVHVGGPFTPEQHALASTLGIKDAIVELPFLGRTLLAALYRRASVLALPSDREGFGLPLIEAMACGTPVVASAVPALREAGGIAAIYCAPGDVQQWVETLTSLLRQRESDPAAWAARQTAGIVAAARFNWNTYATAMTELYIRTGGRAALSQ